MRNFTKLMLIGTMLFVCLGGVKATIKNWSPSSWVATWNGETNTMSWNGSDGYKVMYSGLIHHGDETNISSYTKIRVRITSITGNSNHINIKIGSTGKSDQEIPLYVGDNDVVFANYSTGIDLEKVKEITFWGTSTDNGSAVITECYLYDPAKTVKVANFGDEVTSLVYITGDAENAPHKFVISDNGTKAMYFTGNQDSKSSSYPNVPEDSYFYMLLEKVSDSGASGSDIYRVRIQNEDGTDYPNGISHGPYLNITSWSSLFSGTSAKDVAKNYGQDGDKWGLWHVSYDAEKGFSFQNVGREKWLKVDGAGDAQQYLKLYKSLNFSSSTDLEKEENAANDEIFALADATGYNSETGVLTDGGWTFETPVDLSDWDYLIITTEETQYTDNTNIRIQDNSGNYVEKDGYDPGSQPQMYFSVWNNHNVACISMDYLRKEKGLDISKIKSLSFSGVGIKISTIYLTDYENTKIGPSRGRWTYYVDGDVVRNYTESTVGKFGTICLPYVASCAGAEVYSIAGKVGNSLSLTKVTGLLEAGKPYFYKASDATGKRNDDVHNVNFFRADLAKYDAASAGTDNGLVGTFSEISAPLNSYVLSSNKLYKVDGAVTVGANKAYVDVAAITPSLSRGNIFIDFNEPTGVSEMKVMKTIENQEVYNLAGQRVAQPTKGLYIVNGKKVLVK